MDNSEDKLLFRIEIHRGGEVEQHRIFITFSEVEDYFRKVNLHYSDCPKREPDFTREGILKVARMCLGGILEHFLYLANRKVLIQEVESKNLNKEQSEKLWNELQYWVNEPNNPPRSEV